MIPINELRIGSYVSIKGSIKRVSLISDDSIFSEMPVLWMKGDLSKDVQKYGTADIEPVPMSDQVLSQCGFVFHDYFRFWQLIDTSSKRFKLDIDPDYNIIDFMRRPLVKKISSLHQLQNIYFALK